MKVTTITFGSYSTKVWNVLLHLFTLDHDIQYNAAPSAGYENLDARQSGLIDAVIIALELEVTLIDNTTEG